MKTSQKSTMNELISCGLYFTGGLHKYDLPFFSYLLTLYEKYKQGTLPFPGSMSEQPAQIVEIFQVFDQLDFEKQEKIAREQAAEIKKAQRKK